MPPEGDPHRTGAIAHQQASVATPEHRYDARRTHTPSVSQRSLVCLEGGVYSVRFGDRSIDYRHYVRELARKPQAVRQVAAELIRDLGPPFDTAWRSLVDAHGPKQAARVFAKVLAHIETRGVDLVATALAKGEPLLLALAPAVVPSAVVAREALPPSLRDVEIASGRAADYDTYLVGGGS